MFLLARGSEKSFGGEDDDDAVYGSARGGAKVTGRASVEERDGE